MGALATKPRRTPVGTRSPVRRPSHPPNLAGAVQGNLFTPIVIPISTPLTPPARVAAPPVGASQRARSNASSSGTKQPGRRTPRTAAGQGELEFLSPMPSKPRTLSTTVDAVILCEATAATPMHRAVAAVLDWSMIFLGYGLFLLTFFLCGGGFDLNRNNLLTFGAALLLIGCTYGLFWTITGTETLGMRWTHLRLITFDGFRPDLAQRLMRFAAFCLSFFTLVGVLWALADEESLGWQDHMSRTFPTAHELESRIFLRR
jgi:uncharacterized RDD family membrane protein YckC